ncbi:MAG: YdeI/OmpD-associated family protein [Bacteroidota bacterium]
MERTREASVFFEQGCGRCPKGGTPACKVHRWDRELALLRSWILEAGLVEECKWGVPCYTMNGRNLVMLSALKDACVLSFLDGAWLKDVAGLLEKPGPNSVRDRVIRWRSWEALQGAEVVVKELLQQHINGSPSAQGVQSRQTKGSPKKESHSSEKGSGSTEGTPDYPAELQTYMQVHPDFAQAFEALTPGRRRGYLLHFSGAAQSTTRLRRIETSRPKVMAGKGMQE